MDLCAARRSPSEVVVAAARIIGSGLLLPKLEARYFRNRDAADEESFGLMLRATAYVPFINGFRGAVSIDGDRYVDGGLVHRVPLDLIPEGQYDELWIAACSPNGIRELRLELDQSQRDERLVIVTPSSPLPVGRWTMKWSRIREAIELGRRDMETAIELSKTCNHSVAVGAAVTIRA
jgi:predicted patatin/cPLA2 family phospholipase